MQKVWSEHMFIEAEIKPRYNSLVKTTANTKTQSKAASKLALHGGSPVRSTLLSYSRQNIDESDIEAVAKALRGDIITRGPSVDAFERKLSELCEMPYAVSFTSATAGLHAVMALLNAGEGRVITSPITFAATSNAVLYCGGKPEFQDIDAQTMNLDPKALKDLKGVTAVVAVDFAGNACDYNALYELQKKYKFRLIGDAAHSLGGSYQNRPVGSLADISVLSFHPVKSVTTGEGGVVLCKNKDEAEFLKRFRGHGIVRTDVPGFYKQESLGYNYYMTDMQAALGLSQLDKLESFVRMRTDIAKAYDKFFAKMDLVEIPKITPGAKSSWHLYPLRLNLSKLQSDRTEILRALQAENIGANVHYIPVYWHPYYERLGYKRGLCPVAEAEYLREISIPIFPGMTSKDVTDVCTAVEKVLEAYRN